MRDNKKYNIAITQKIPAIAKKMLTDAGFRVTMNMGARLNTEEMIDFTRYADAIISLLSDNMNSNVISNLENCQIIANYAAGYNNIDLIAAQEKKLTITNTPGVLTDATADLTLALMLSAARHIVPGDSFMRQGKFIGWQSDLYLGTQLNASTVGIIGAGRIGKAVARRVHAFGAKIIYYSRTVSHEMEIAFNAEFVPLDALMSRADIITLHTPLTRDTYHLLNKKMLNLMKKSAILINTARGEIVDEKYLISQLQKGKIACAAFDVYENEPQVNPALFQLPNVVLAPHTGSGTVTTRDTMARIAAENVINVLSGKPATTPVKL
ncbi:MAG: D-glycerate dehydrogenase [Ignavibacteria bacterium]|nr:D-glycerate dehydrogenase [Ignavibacteria bacterium]